MELICVQVNVQCKTHVDADDKSAAVRATTEANAEVCRKCGSENGIVLYVSVIWIWFSKRAQKERKVGGETHQRINQALAKDQAQGAGSFAPIEGGGGGGAGAGAPPVGGGKGGSGH